MQNILLLVLLGLLLPVNAMDVSFETNTKQGTQYYTVHDVEDEVEGLNYIESIVKDPKVKSWKFTNRKIIKEKLLVLPDSPTEWAIGQKVHVRIRGLSNGDKADQIAYTQSKIDPLKLDIKLVFDDNLKLPSGISEGISISYIPVSVECYGTRKITGYLQDANGNLTTAHRIMSIRIGLDCYGGKRDNLFRDGSTSEIYWFNVFLHEFNHALDMDHLTWLKKMPEPLMNHYASATKLLWTYADQWQLKRKYATRDRLLNYRRINFKRSEPGKTCYLINGDDSISFKIGSQSELLPYVKNLSKYKKVVK